MCRLPLLSVKKYGNYGQKFIYVRKSVQLADPIFRKLTVAPRLFVKEQNTKFRVNWRWSRRDERGLHIGSYL